MSRHDDDTGRLTFGALIVMAVTCAVLVARWALRWHPWATLTLAGLAAVAVLWGPAAVFLICGLVCLALALWGWLAPASFDRMVVGRARAGIRFEWIYRWRWAEAMSLIGLTGQVHDRPSIGKRPARLAQRRPEMVRLVSTPTVDRLLVRHRLGHEQTHWDIRTAALAETFRARACRVSAADPGYLWLNFYARETLAETVRPLAPRPAERIDFEALRVGVTEDRTPWRLRLMGSHLLIGGASGAGKSSVIWSILHELAPAVAAGVVQVMALDPKGGMELTPGEALFTRYAYPTPGGDSDPATSMVELIEETAELVTWRADAMRRAGVRKFAPSPTDPLVVLLVDELAYLTSYMTDPSLRRRAHLAMGTILTQGRAPGVVVIGAVQDVRKETIPHRDLFLTRVALRTTEAAHADLILGDGAYKAGALCDRIPETLPGVGYVPIDGQTTPTRVRAAYLTDHDITTTAQRYPAPTLTPIEGESDDLGEAA